MTSIEVYERSLEFFVNKGKGEFTSVNGGDFKRMFELYDEVVYEHKITEKLKEREIILDFQVKATFSSKPPCAAIDLPEYYKDDMNIMKVTFFPSMINQKKDHIISLIPLDKANLPFISSNDRLKATLSIVEYVTVHLMMILWNTYNESSSHGDIFQGLMKYYFGYLQMNSRFTVVRKPSFENDFIERPMITDNETAEGDFSSLAMVFLTLHPSFFREILFGTCNTQVESNKGLKRLGAELSYVYNKAEGNVKTLKWSQMIESLFNTYVSPLNISDITELYESFTLAFPKMEISNVELSRGAFLKQNFKTFSISDLSKDPSNHPYIFWRRLYSPMLVFSSKHCVSGNLKSDYGFDYEIIDGRYELAAMIMKVQTTSECHYFAFVKTENGWCYYRKNWLKLTKAPSLSFDLSKKSKCVSGYPKDILYIKPELIFYSLNNDYKGIQEWKSEKKVIKTNNVRLIIYYARDRANISVEFFKPENEKLKQEISNLKPDSIISRDYWIWKVDPRDGNKLFQKLKKIVSNLS